MSLKVSNLNGIKVYHCTAGRSTPQYYSDLVDKKLSGSLRYNEDYRRRIDLIQDFDFPTASNRIRLSPDQASIGATGVYGPQFKCFELQQLSMKFERHIDSEIIDFSFLTDDWRKLLFLRADRTIEVHAQFGKHHVIKIPKFGRSLAYQTDSCDAFVTAADSEIYRLNLEQGRFLGGISTTSTSGINCSTINPVHQLLSFGSADGQIHCYDPRDRAPLHSFSVLSTLSSSHPRIYSQLLTHQTSSSPSSSSSSSSSDIQVSSITSGLDGLSLAVGLSTGHVLLYDLRSPVPHTIKDHRYGEPIISMHYHPSTNNIITADKKSAKIWNTKTGDMYTSIEPTAAINDVEVVPNTGLILCASETQRIQVYYIPSLGPAPRWCSFLDSLTEELEESKTTSLYDDYQFLTRSQLDQYGLTHLIGTTLLRAYMHGFFIDNRLYERVKAAANPDAYEKYMEEKQEEKRKKKLENKIVIKKQQLPTVNKQLAQQLIKSTSTSSSSAKGGSLVDSRFSALFEKSEYEIDPTSEDYQRINPSAHKNFTKKHKDQESDEEENEEDEDEEGGRENFNLVEEGEEEEEEEEEEYDEDEDEEAEEGEASSSSSHRPRSRAPAMYELKPGLGIPNVLSNQQKSSSSQPGSASAALSSASARTTLSLAERLELEERAREEEMRIKKRRIGNEEIERSGIDPAGSSEKRQRRGMVELIGTGEESSRGGRGRGRGRGRGGSRGRGGGGRGRGGGGRGGGGRGRGAGRR